MSEIRIILDNIRSVHNVGSIFRTAETLGISKIYCLETTPTPLDRFKNKRKDFAKVSLGAEEIVAWEHIDDIKGLVKELKKDGFKIVSLEQDEKSVDYKKINISGNTVIVLGNEVDGVSKYLLQESDEIAEIPMMGKKESLNVSVAGAVFLYRILDK